MEDRDEQRRLRNYPGREEGQIRHRPGVDDVQVTERLPEYQQPQRCLHHADPTGVAQDQDSQRQTDWAERDLALILTALRPPAGRGTPPGQRRRHPAPPTTAPRSSPSKAKAARNAAWPNEGELLSVSETYLNSRAIRFPDAVKRKGAAAGSGLPRWPAGSPLFVGRNGERITRGTLQSRSNGRSNVPAPTLSPSPEPWSTDCGTPTPRNSPAPTSASTPS